MTTSESSASHNRGKSLTKSDTVHGRLLSAYAESARRCQELARQLHKGIPTPPWRALCQLAEQSGELPFEITSQRARLAADWIQCARKAMEIDGWLHPETRLPKVRAERADRLVQLLESAGWPYSAIKVAEQAVLEGRKGRPPRKRVIAVKACDLKLRTGKSWAQITRQVCNCGQPQHGHDCQERLRQQINDLRACMKKYGIRIPSRIALLKSQTEKNTC